jgi:cytochrome c biogenesis protein CcmG, thiol:disulfide interchange protein DsbE
VLVLALGLVAAGCAGGTQDASIGQQAPPVAGPTIDGGSFDLAEWRGRPVVVNFWASWCGPCRDEFPLFHERAEALGETDGLVLVGVLYKDDPAAAQRFAEDFGATWSTVVDQDGALAARYRVVAPPQTYFIDSSGVLQAIQIGEVRAEDFDRQYAKIAP